MTDREMTVSVGIDAEEAEEKLDELTQKALAMKEAVEAAEKPIQHDGWKSRKFISCSLFGLILISLSTVLRWYDKIDQTYFLYGALAGAAVLLVGNGLLELSKAMELIKLKLLGGRKA